MDEFLSASADETTPYYRTPVVLGTEAKEHYELPIDELDAMVNEVILCVLNSVEPTTEAYEEIITFLTDRRFQKQLEDKIRRMDAGLRVAKPHPGDPYVITSVWFESLHDPASSGFGKVVGNRLQHGLPGAAFTIDSLKELPDVGKAADLRRLSASIEAIKGVPIFVTPSTVEGLDPEQAPYLIKGRLYASVVYRANLYNHANL